MNATQGMRPATKADVEEVAAMANKQFTNLEKKINGVGSDIKLVLSAIETLSGQIADVKQSTVSALDYARLEGRVEALESRWTR
jgi:hypothetical protein